jgi:hypothetical protein
VSSEELQGRPNRLPWIAFALIVIIATTITVAYFVAREQEQRQEEERRAEKIVVRGFACDVLGEASDAYQSGDQEILKSSIKEAKRLAIKALGTTGIGFGRAEEEAIRLAKEDLTSDESLKRVEDRLAAASEYCSRIES